MADVSALDKYACPACGAQAEWNPTKQTLLCASCGTESPYQLKGVPGTVAEVDLIATLQKLEKSDGVAEKRRVQCQSCKAVMTFDAERVGQNCEFCGSPALLSYDDIQADVHPHGVLPFKIDRHSVRDTIRTWLKGRWLAPGRLGKGALVDTVKSLYIPYWTFDAAVHCPWTAEAGHYYYENEEYTDSKGHRSTRRVRHTRWEYAAGSIDHSFDDELVPGTEGVSVQMVREVEPFPTGECVPYDAGYVSGHVVEHYRLPLGKALDRANEQMTRVLKKLCAEDVPGDTYRNLEISPDYSKQTFKLVLVPIWLLTYNYGSRVFDVVVNGYTGRIAGKYPFSRWKVFFLIVVVLIILIPMLKYLGPILLEILAGELG